MWQIQEGDHINSWTLKPNTKVVQPAVQAANNLYGFITTTKKKASSSIVSWTSQTEDITKLKQVEVGHMQQLQKLSLSWCDREYWF
jgi:hypothetical protein